MNPYAESGYPFTIPDLWRTINSAEIQHEKIASPADCWVLTKHGLDLGLDFEGKNEDLPGFFGPINFSIPDLDELEYRTLENLEPQEESFTPELTDDSGDEIEKVLVIAPPVEEDVWLCPDVIAQVELRPKLQSWELFNDSGFEEPPSELFSERGAVAFDAAVIAHEYEEAIGDRSRAKYGTILQSDPLLKVGFSPSGNSSTFAKDGQGLSLLRLGQESIFFRYLKSEQTFQPRIENGRMSGYTMDSFGRLVALRPFYELSSNWCPVLRRISFIMETNDGSWKHS